MACDFSWAYLHIGQNFEVTPGSNRVPFLSDDKTEIKRVAQNNQKFQGIQTMLKFLLSAPVMANKAFTYKRTSSVSREHTSTPRDCSKLCG